MERVWTELDRVGFVEGWEATGPSLGRKLESTLGRLGITSACDAGEVAKDRGGRGVSSVLSLGRS